MSIEYINVGDLPNDGTGDPLRTAFQKINNNFVTMEQSSTNITSAVTLDDSANQVIFEYPAAQFTQGTFQVQSYRQDNNDSQNALISTSIYNDLSNVIFTVYGIMNNGDWLTNYDMDVSDGNVRLLVNPIQNAVIQHFIAYQVTYAGDLGIGTPITTQSGDQLVTETQNVNITTEG